MHHVPIALRQFHLSFLSIRPLGIVRATRSMSTNDASPPLKILMLHGKYFLPQSPPYPQSPTYSPFPHQATPKPPVSSTPKPVPSTKPSKKSSPTAPSSSPTRPPRTASRQPISPASYPPHPHPHTHPHPKHLKPSGGGAARIDLMGKSCMKAWRKGWRRSRSA